MLSMPAPRSSILPTSVSRRPDPKTWYLLLLVMEVNVDVLRMTGTVQNALHVHFTPLVSILMVEGERLRSPPLPGNCPPPFFSILLGYLSPLKSVHWVY